jgi:uncharacterized membrane protein YkoI
LIYEFISLPLSFHPATALVKRRIRETREISCDELVTEKLLDAAVYARSLVHLASSVVNLSRPTATITVGIADADNLEERVMSILRRPKTNTRRKNLLLVAAALIFIVPCVAAAPFAFRIGVAPQSLTISPDDSVVTPNASVMTVQQGARQKAKQEEKAPEGKTRKPGELRPVILWREVTEMESQKREGRSTPAPPVLVPQRKRERVLQEPRTQEKVYKLKTVAETREQKESRERLVAKQQAELAKKANITMQQAIQIALSQQAGKVIECHLIERLPKIPDKDQVFYNLTIVSGDEPQSASTQMLISAVDGRVVATRKY